MKRFLKISIFICGLFLIGIFVVNMVVYHGSKSRIYENIADAPNAQTVIIPGAAIFPDGALSSIFLDRADKAIALYEARKVSKILVSGDNSTDIHNEVNPVRLYLISKGIPEGDIYLDHAGFDTYSTMYRARDIFKVKSVIVSTQSFHIKRAVFTARMLGIEVYGVKADNGPILFRNYLREILANEKTVMNLIFHRKPKYLGDTIPID